MIMGFSFTGSSLAQSPSASPLFNNSAIAPTIISTKLPLFSSCVFYPSSRIPNPRRRFSISCTAINQQSFTTALSISEKVQRLGFEFKSLPEPIDRVKRLLHYATLLPRFDESSRIQENRVMGCTTQVWLDVKMDGNGIVRFRVDSDSEITKGFCSCLISVLDGAEADAVLSVGTDDFEEINVGLPSRGKSRVNTWHNVLISMQRRTKNLVLERSGGDHQSLEPFASLVAGKGSYEETKL